MANAQKPAFVFRRNGRVHLNRRGASVQSTTGSRGVRISGSNVGYTMFRGSVKGTGFPLHSPVSPSLPSRASPCAVTFQLESTTRYPELTPECQSCIFMEMLVSFVILLLTYFLAPPPFVNNLLVTCTSIVRCVLIQI